MTDEEIQRLGEQMMVHVRNCANPIERERMQMNLIMWQDSKRDVPRNSKAGCLANQASLIAQFEQWQNRAAK